MLYRVSEKIATPTSVVLMGQMSVFGFWFRYFWMEDISEQAWNYWLVCIPIVPIGAPLGSICATMVTRMTLGFGLKPTGNLRVFCYILVREYLVKPKKLVLYISSVLSSLQWGLVSLYQRSLYYQFFVVE